MMGLICVSCPNEFFALEAGVRLRPVPELGVCLAYTPKHPALHRLNATSWLIASLCDGRSLTDIAERYRAALGGNGDVEVALERGIEQLTALGIIRRSSTYSGGRKPAEGTQEGGVS
jgi:hypothetical protein